MKAIKPVIISVLSGLCLWSCHDHTPIDKLPALGGGKGGVLGTLLGVFLFTLLGNVLNYMNISTFVQWTIQGFIIIAAVFFQARRGGGRP